MRNSILITGAGQLGSRYLQGLSRVDLPLDIYVQDISPASLAQAESRWSEMKPAYDHTVHFIGDFSSLPENITVAIVSTTAAIRVGVVRAVLQNTQVRYWLLEKILAQSIEEINEIESLVKHAEAAWVNTPRRVMPWYAQIKTRMMPGEKIVFNLTGGAWGMACNSVHFIDLIEFWTGEKLRSIDAKGLNSEWIESKRPGYFEITGQLKATFSGGSEAFLASFPQLAETRINLLQNSGQWLIEESVGKAYASSGEVIEGSLKFQSELTATVISDILQTGKCGLPALSQSAAAHRIFISSLLTHWNGSHHQQTNKLPIT